MSKIIKDLVQIRNPLSRKWLLIDVSRGLVLKTRACIFKHIKIIKITKNPITNKTILVDKLRGTINSKKELSELSRDEYIQLLKSGMFWELYPQATGIYSDDIRTE